MTRMILTVLIVVGVALSMGVGLSLMLNTAVADYQQSGSQTTATDQIGTTPANHSAREKPPAGKPKAQKAMSYAPHHAKGMVPVSSQSIH